jgi:hypothetical protein
VTHLLGIVLQINFASQEVENRQVLKCTAWHSCVGAKTRNRQQRLEMETAKVGYLGIYFSRRIARAFDIWNIVKANEAQEMSSHIIISDIRIADVHHFGNCWDTKERTLTNNQSFEKFSTIECKWRFCSASLPILPICLPMFLPNFTESAEEAAWRQEEEFHPIKKTPQQWACCGRH